MTAPSPELPDGYDLAVFDEIDSTNEEARRRGEAGEAGPLWVWGKRQSAGRGRRGRAWVSEEGNLFCTLLLRPHCTPPVAAELSFVAALAVHETLATLIPERRVSLKWPNDALLEGKKIAGILLESSATGETVSWVAIGIGINLAHYPEGTEYPATALSQWAPPPAAAEALGLLAAAMDRWLRVWQEGRGFAAIREAWLRVVEGLGQTINVRLSDHTLTGTFVRLDEKGGLVLDVDGTEHVITAGDIFFPN